MGAPGRLAFPEPAPADDVIVLRPWRGGDADAVAVAVRDTAVRRFRASHPRSDQEAHAWLRGALEPAADRLELAIADAGSGAMLGSISLRDLNRHHRSATISYWVAAPARGRGVASRALGLLAHWCFEELGLARLALFIDIENVASQRVARRCHFVREGVLRSHLESGGQRHDSIVYGLLPSDLP